MPPASPKHPVPTLAMEETEQNPMKSTRMPPARHSACFNIHSPSSLLSRFRLHQVGWGGRRVRARHRCGR